MTIKITSLKLRRTSGEEEDYDSTNEKDNIIPRKQQVQTKLEKQTIRRRSKNHKHKNQEEHIKRKDEQDSRQ